VPHRHPSQLFPAVGGELTVGGVKVSRLAVRVGGTPFYAYDRALISNRVAELRAALPESVRLHYAIKANPMPAVVHHMAGLVDGLDVASGGEMLVALDTGMRPDHVSFAGPGKRPEELAQAVAAGVCLNAESERELTRIAHESDRLGQTARIAVRVNPDFELKSSGMKMGGGATQFGIDAERVPAALAMASDLGLQVEGLHIFAGSQNLRAEAVAEAQTKSIALAARFAASTNFRFRHVNIGGGLGIPYFPGESPIDVHEVGQRLDNTLAHLDPALEGARIVIELGRYLIGEAGIYVCRITDRKESRGRVFLVTDGGLHHHLAASGNFGQVIRKDYPVVIGTRMDDELTETANVVGPLCTPLDLLSSRELLASAEPGDLVVVFQSGAYGRTASPERFLGHPPPREVLV